MPSIQHKYFVKTLWITFEHWISIQKHSCECTGWRKRELLSVTFNYSGPLIELDWNMLVKSKTRTWPWWNACPTLLWRHHLYWSLTMNSYIWWMKGKKFKAFAVKMNWMHTFHISYMSILNCFNTEYYVEKIYIKHWIKLEFCLCSMVDNIVSKYD